MRPATLPDPATVLEKGLRAGSPSVGASSSKASPHNASRSNSSHAPPLSPPHRSQRGITPGRLQSPLVGGPRKLTVLEQLNHSDWKIRVEGVVVVACILAKRTPPNYDGHKMPTLPPSDVFAPTLAKLLNDPQPEVVEHVVAPEVLAELAKVVPMEQVVPKVLLLSEGDDEQHAQPINTSSMPALKQLMTQDEAANLLFQLLQSMNSPGVVPRKYSVGTVTTIQKRKIIHGCLIWMNELVENYASGLANEFFSELNNYKLVVNRLIGMLNTTKAQNLIMLAALLKGLQKLDVETFDKILLTFESSIIKDLRRAWGVNVEDDVESVVVEEKVADVQQVLGSVPQVGGTMLPPSQARRIIPEPASPDDSVGGLEDFTLINVPPAPQPVTPPAHSTFDHEALKNLPPLPSTPERSAWKVPRTEEKPAIKVYQDPVVDSNGAVATGDRTTMSSGNEWHRSKLRKQISSSNLPKTPGDSSRLLRTLIQRLRARDLDTQAFRKLIGIARENPVREPLQEANGEDLHDIWQGGPVFEELLTALLDYLGSEDIELSRVSDLRVQGLLVLKQLLAKAAPYFALHEADVLSTLIGIRGKHPAQSQVTTGVEEISEEYMQVADPKAGIDAILDVSLPTGNPSFRLPTQSWCMSLFCLAALVRASAPSFLETQLDRLGQLAVKVRHS
jgi:CLIP-associating protein 1/2